ncbi:hypothetical protein DFH27DRAFT_80112 [Peziza echinospora]|nr:hypothetical protein DFH27DRAFT_80112 [Peziza echinospora]
MIFFFSFAVFIQSRSGFYIQMQLMRCGLLLLLLLLCVVIFSWGSKGYVLIVQLCLNFIVCKFCLLFYICFTLRFYTTSTLPLLTYFIHCT